MPRAPKEPPRIPGYEILEGIGSGGQGAVWRARQLSLDRIVAFAADITRRLEAMVDPPQFVKFDQPSQAGGRAGVFSRRSPASLALYAERCADVCVDRPRMCRVARAARTGPRSS